jgi:hypothetical protein
LPGAQEGDRTEETHFLKRWEALESKRERRNHLEGGERECSKK